MPRGPAPVRAWGACSPPDPTRAPPHGAPRRRPGPARPRRPARRRRPRRAPVRRRRLRRRRRLLRHLRLPDHLAAAARGRAHRAGSRSRGFYARRARRILPAATAGARRDGRGVAALAQRRSQAAEVGRATPSGSAFFAANIHFAAPGTDYFAAGRGRRRRSSTTGRWRWRSSSTSSGRCCSRVVVLAGGRPHAAPSRRSLRRRRAVASLAWSACTSAVADPQRPTSPPRPGPGSSASARCSPCSRPRLAPPAGAAADALGAAGLAARPRRRRVALDAGTTGPRHAAHPARRPRHRRPGRGRDRGRARGTPPAARRARPMTLARRPVLLALPVALAGAGARRPARHPRPARPSPWA